MRPALHYPPGARIAGRYEVAGRPLMGGMGIVYVCFDHQEQRPVALKTFKPEYLPDRAVRDRFLREGTTWVNLGRHPHVVRCYRVIHLGLEVYLVLELVAKEDGRKDASLRSWLVPGRPLSIEQALLFALQIARGLAHATSVLSGFVHRDLKPENILVGADRLPNAAINRLRVTDFGLATVLQEVYGRTSESAIEGGSSMASKLLRRTRLTRGIIGTPLYMAPEQWRGERVTVQTDIYALGCILYEMLVGQRAVKGNSLAALERAHCAGRVQPLPGILPEVVTGVVQRCLEVKPEERYGSWGKAEAALAGACAEVAGRAAPKPQPARKLNQAERAAAGWSYVAIAGSYLGIGKAREALRYFERVRKVGKAERERLLEGAALTGLGEAHRNLGDMQQAIRYYEQALALARKVGNRDGERGALSGLGIVYKTLGDVQQAIRYHERALEIAREVGNRGGEGDALANLGIAYRALEDGWRAIEYYERALVVWREIGDRRREGADLGNLGNAYADLGDAQRAIELYNQTLAIWHEIGNRHGEGVHLCNLGSTYYRLGDARQAIECYRQALTIQREVGDMKGVALDLLNMALSYTRLGELDQALPLAQQAAELSTRIGYTHCAQRAQRLVAQLRAREW